MGGAHRGGSVNPAPAAGPCLFPGLWERECVGVLPVKRLMQEGGAGERKREGRCQTRGGVVEGGQHARGVRERRVCRRCNKKKTTVPVNKYSNLNNRAETRQEGDIIIHIVSAAAASMEATRQRRSCHQRGDMRDVSGMKMLHVRFPLRRLVKHLKSEHHIRGAAVISRSVVRMVS